MIFQNFFDRFSAPLGVYLLFIEQSGELFYRKTVTGKLLQTHKYYRRRERIDDFTRIMDVIYLIEENIIAQTAVVLAVYRNFAVGGQIVAVPGDLVLKGLRKSVYSELKAISG